ncbi:MAG: hypothetical protein V3T08_10015 [Gemmatimonadota bacterium]
MITLDFETRSEANLKKVGTYEYARHPSTDVLCLAYALGGQENVELWHPGFKDQTPLIGKTKAERAQPPQDLLCSPSPLDLFCEIAIQSLIEAHNAFFERCIWHFVMVRKYGWPVVRPQQWRCSAAKAASYALPRKLEDAAIALGLREQKDMEGHKLMIRMSKSRRPTKGDPDSTWHQKRADLDRLFEYCRQDVRAERELSRQLREMPDQEIEVWQLDQEMNFGGMHCDLDMARAALKIADQARDEASRELEKITGGVVTTTTQRPRFVAWLKENGVQTDSVAAPVVDEFLESGTLAEHTSRALYLWRRSSKASVKKYDAMLLRTSEDGRCRDLVMYHGASTGRWSGRGIQPHNFPRGFDEARMHAACGDILYGDFARMKLLYGEDEVMDVLSNALRGALVPAPGHDLVVADYSAIEARGTFWIAGHRAGLRVFEEFDAGRGPDIYCWQAEKIHGRPISKKDPERQDGKVVILGCGYQMGGPKLVSYAAPMGIELTEDRAEELVEEYREINEPVVSFWRKIQGAAIRATRRRGTGPAIPCGRLKWKVLGRFLHCRLPNGRLLSYLDPQVRMKEITYEKKVNGVKKEFTRIVPNLTFMGMDTYTHKWTRCSTYGGKLTENVVQALCRDIMADAMLRLRGTTYRPVLTVHDEIVTEVPEGKGDVAEFRAIMAEQPKWADGFPITASGYRDKRFRKD